MLTRDGLTKAYATGYPCVVCPRHLDYLDYTVNVFTYLVDILTSDS